MQSHRRVHAPPHPSPIAKGALVFSIREMFPWRALLLAMHPGMLPAAAWSPGRLVPPHPDNNTLDSLQGVRHRALKPAECQICARSGCIGGRRQWANQTANLQSPSIVGSGPRRAYK